MNLNSEIEFCVDQQYENEKGVFTVISIQNEEMVIRWTNGEQIRTEIDLQQRIQARRQREKTDLERLANVARFSARKSSPSSKGEEFQGLQPGDFKNSAAQTTWRSRNQLGGAVTKRLPKTEFKFNSWAFGQKPEIHWSDTEHRSRDNAECQARFFVRLDRLSLTFGFGVARPDGDNRSASDWDSFLGWVTQPKNETMIYDLAFDNDLAVHDSVRLSFIGLTPFEGAWRIDGPKEQKKVDSLTAHLESLPALGGADFEITMKIDKDDVLARGEDIALDIAKIFGLLMPLYHATIM